MTLNDYQKAALKTAKYPTIDGAPGLYPALGLNGEAGEVAEKIKKWWRDGASVGGAQELRFDVALELGDVLWYLSAVAQDLGLSLESVAKMNLQKLASRTKRGTLAGAGDHR